MASYKIFLRTESPRKNKSIPVYLRARVENKKKDYSLGVSILEPEKYWDPEANQMKKCDKQKVKEINQVVSAADKLARDIIYKHTWGAKMDEPFSIDDFDLEFTNKLATSTSFYAFATNEVEILKKKNASRETIRGYNSYISKLKTFTPTLSFHEITRDFVTRYHTYMVSKLKNQVNTVHKSLSFMRTMIKRAHRDGLMEGNPFEYYPLQKKAGVREFLTIHELEVLEKKYAEGTMKGYQANTCKSFLFSCYTGLRFQDTKNLRFDDIKEEVHNGKKGFIIRITMHKTKDPVSIPLIDKAVNLIGQGYGAQKVFRVPSNQVANRFLKEIATAAEIHKTITFHVSRHTFATNSITLGIPIEVISKLLGHTNLKNTMIYAKVVDSAKIAYMDRWNKSDVEMQKVKAKQVRKDLKDTSAKVGAETKSTAKVRKVNPAKK